MKRDFPQIEININKIAQNTKNIIDLCSKSNIHVVGVSKVFCARIPIVEAMLSEGIEIIGDSRIENLKRLKDLKCRKMLLRIPMESSANEVVKYSDISLNSETDTIKSLSKAAKRINKIHSIILMIDVGDLREGILESEVMDTVREILSFSNIRLCGIGTNLTCYGGIIPDENNLGKLISLKVEIEKNFGLSLSVVSGGNSSSLYAVMEGTIPEEINQLRIGEAILLGRETSYGRKVPGCAEDAFVIKGEIIEIKHKPSVPTGKIGVDAFGNIPKFEDKGIIKRAIIALGRQDIVPEGLIPIDQGIDILGASSDHLITDITNCSANYKLGDIMNFNMNYGCLLRAMTSPYVKKYYTE